MPTPPLRACARAALILHTSHGALHIPPDAPVRRELLPNGALLAERASHLLGRASEGSLLCNVSVRQPL